MENLEHKQECTRFTKEKFWNNLYPVSKMCKELTEISESLFMTMF